MPMSTLDQMAGPKAPESSRLRLRKMHVMQLLNSMGTIGKAGCWKSVKIGLLGLLVEDLVVVVDLEVVFEEVLVVEADSGVDTVVVTVDEVGMEVADTLPLAVTMLAQPLLPLRQIPSRITLHLEERKASSFTSVTYGLPLLICLHGY